jgi:hypothetical protein
MIATLYAGLLAFAARYWVVRGWREIGPCDVDGDYTNESAALARADELNLDIR